MGTGAGARARAVGGDSRMVEGGESNFSEGRGEVIVVEGAEVSEHCLVMLEGAGSDGWQ